MTSPKHTEDAPQIAPRMRVPADNASALSVADYAAAGTIAHAVNPSVSAIRAGTRDTTIQQPVQPRTEPLLRFYGGVHWHCRNIEQLACLLQRMGYRNLATESPNEYRRLWKPCHGTVIVKHNGWASARSGGMVDLAEIAKARL